MLCVAGGLGHLVVVQQQLVHGIGAALPFLVAAAAQLALARLVWAAGRPAVLLLTVGALYAIISLYVVGVMAGFTLGPHGEAVRADPVRTVVVVAQLGAVALLLLGLGGAHRRRAFNGVLVGGAALWALRLSGLLG
jgi:MYXO-CTERM domain-containing protein